MLWLVAVSESRAAGHGDHARVGVDREPAAGVVVQRVGDRVVGGIGVGGAGRDADGRADDGVFGHRLAAGVGIA